MLNGEGLLAAPKASETGSGLMLRTVFSMVLCLICCDNSTIPGCLKMKV